MKRLQEIYHRYKGADFGYLYRMTGSAGEAEELTQETFYQAILSIHRFRGDASVQTWLLRIARNLYLKRMRRRETPVAFVEEMLPGTGPGPELEVRVLVHRARQRLHSLYIKEDER